MEDYVRSLTYHLDTAELYEVAEPLEFERGGAVFHLDRDVLSVSLLKRYVTVESARATVEATIREWQFQHRLLQGGSYFEFRFQLAEGSATVRDLASSIPEPCSMKKDYDGPLLLVQNRYPE